MTARVVIVGLGPGPRNTVTQATLEAIERIDVQFVRTKRHPTADLMPRATSFDSLYDTLPTFEDVYREITKAVVTAALGCGEVLYAVPGSPLILESSVAQLRADSRVEVQVLPALSFLDLAWEALGIDPVNAGVRLIDGHRFALEASGERGPLLVAQVHADWVLSDVKLSHESANGNEPVVLLHHLGLPDQRVEHTTWQELDRVLPADHLTTLYIAQMAEPVAGELARLHQLARTLREQCPWDREQTHDSLIKHLIEETYEVVDAIEALDANDPASDEALIEELGDLLYQVEFHATIAEQQGRFSMADVARSIHDKLVRRHPHVFGNVVANSASDVVQTWDEVKRAEKKSVDSAASTFTGVAKSGPSLQYATKIQKRAADVGFDWPNSDGAFEKIIEESAEIRQAVALNSDPDTIRMELGDLLFSVVNLSRHLGHDAEQALRGASEKFRHRFEQVEQLALSRDIDLANAPLEQLDALWDEVKKQ